MNWNQIVPADDMYLLDGGKIDTSDNTKIFTETPKITRLDVIIH